MHLLWDIETQTSILLSTLETCFQPAPEGALSRVTPQWDLEAASQAGKPGVETEIYLQSFGVPLLPYSTGQRLAQAFCGSEAGLYAQLLDIFAGLKKVCDNILRASRAMSYL